jgi:hypothetical protein
MPQDVGSNVIPFAAMLYAMQMVDQLAVEAGMNAEDVIDHFEQTYSQSIDDGDESPLRSL